MSHIRSRLLQPTGLEFYDTAYKIDKEIWDFIKGNFKGKTEGIPARYWQTHAIPLHQVCWNMIGEIKKANSIYPPYTAQTYIDRLQHQQNAIGHLQTLYELLKLTLTEIDGIDGNKLRTALDLMEKENQYLRKWKNSTKKPKQD